MSNIQPPINPDDRSKEWIEFHRMEGDKRGKDQVPPEPPSSKIYTLLKFILKKVFPSSSREDKKTAVMDTAGLARSLASLVYSS